MKIAINVKSNISVAGNHLPNPSGSSAMSVIDQKVFQQQLMIQRQLLLQSQQYQQQQQQQPSQQNQQAKFQQQPNQSLNRKCNLTIFRCSVSEF